MSVYDLPLLNAVLNTLATIFLIRGFLFIKSGQRELHKKSMLIAFLFSVLFMVSYLVFHYQVGSVPFSGMGFSRTLYFMILIPHSILAAIVPFFILFILFLALRGQFVWHKKIARWVFPLWLFISVTGVLLYLMNYVIWPSTSLIR